MLFTSFVSLLCIIPAKKERKKERKKNLTFGQVGAGPCLGFIFGKFAYSMFASDCLDGFGCVDMSGCRGDCELDCSRAGWEDGWDGWDGRWEGGWDGWEGDASCAWGLKEKIY